MCATHPDPDTWVRPSRESGAVTRATWPEGENMPLLHVYRHGKTWHCARFVNGEFDCSYSLNIDDSASDAEAIAAAALSETDCRVVRVGDIS